MLHMDRYPEDGSSPVHISRYNLEDKRPVLSPKMTLEDGTIAPGTHLIFMDGKGTLMKGGEEPEESRAGSFENMCRVTIYVSCNSLIMS